MKNLRLLLLTLSVLTVQFAKAADFSSAQSVDDVKTIIASELIDKDSKLMPITDGLDLIDKGIEKATSIGSGSSSGWASATWQWLCDAYNSIKEKFAGNVFTETWHRWVDLHVVEVIRASKSSSNLSQKIEFSATKVLKDTNAYQAASFTVKTMTPSKDTKTLFGTSDALIEYAKESNMITSFIQAFGCAQLGGESKKSTDEQNKEFEKLAQEGSTSTSLLSSLFRLPTIITNFFKTTTQNDIKNQIDDSAL